MTVKPVQGIAVTALLFVCVNCSVWGTGVYQEPLEFLHEVFGPDLPDTGRIWITGELKESVRGILGHDLNRLRMRYWEQQGRTAWILEEIGKDEPITMGVVVAGDRIERIDVLVFRETRGWEIRYPFFTDQFNGAALEPDLTLDRGIDGISGATLSVNAAVKVARLALLLHQSVMAQAD